MLLPIFYQTSAPMPLSELGMDPSADRMLRDDNAPMQWEIMLLEADRFNEEALGYPLNFMFTLYYESSFDSTPEEDVTGGPEELL